MFFESPRAAPAGSKSDLRPSNKHSAGFSVIRPVHSPCHSLSPHFCPSAPGAPAWVGGVCSQPCSPPCSPLCCCLPSGSPGCAARDQQQGACCWDLCGHGDGTEGGVPGGAPSRVVSAVGAGSPGLRFLDACPHPFTGPHCTQPHVGPSPSLLTPTPHAVHSAPRAVRAPSSSSVSCPIGTPTRLTFRDCLAGSACPRPGGRAQHV